MEFIIFDTEYTSWEGCNLNGWRDWQKKEIVQIAALKVDGKTLEVIEKFNIYVKPKINPILSDYFVQLTGITNEKLAEFGIDFQSAYALIFSFMQSAPVLRQVQYQAQSSLEFLLLHSEASFLPY